MSLGAAFSCRQPQPQRINVSSHRTTAHSKITPYQTHHSSSDEKLNVKGPLTCKGLMAHCSTPILLLICSSRFAWPRIYLPFPLLKNPDFFCSLDRKNIRKSRVICAQHPSGCSFLCHFYPIWSIGLVKIPSPKVDFGKWTYHTWILWVWNQKYWNMQHEHCQMM